MPHKEEKDSSVDASSQDDSSGEDAQTLCKEEQSKELLQSGEEIEKTLIRLTRAFERSQIDEYMRYLGKPWRLFFHNFLAGVARGLGIAMGVSILSAVLLYFLQRLAYRNLPVIGDFIAEIIRIVKAQQYR